MKERHLLDRRLEPRARPPRRPAAVARPAGRAVRRQQGHAGADRERRRQSVDRDAVQGRGRTRGVGRRSRPGLRATPGRGAAGRRAAVAVARPEGRFGDAAGRIRGARHARAVVAGSCKPKERYEAQPHPQGTEELIHVVRGRLALAFGDVSYVIEIGGSAVAHTDRPHAYACDGKSPGAFHDGGCRVARAAPRRRGDRVRRRATVMSSSRSSDRCCWSSAAAWCITSPRNRSRKASNRSAPCSASMRRR